MSGFEKEIGIEITLNKYTKSKKRSSIIKKPIMHNSK